VHKFECKGLVKGGDKTLPTMLRAISQIFLRNQNGQFSQQDFNVIKSMKINRAEQLEKNPDTYVMCAGVKSIMGLQQNVDEIIDLACIAMTNGQTMTQVDLNPIGLFIDPRYACINHSCDPNAIAVFSTRTMRLIAQKSLKKDEEIFINYVDVQLPIHVRQLELKDSYFFTCDCSRCRLGVSEPFERLYCIECRKNTAVAEEPYITCEDCGYVNTKLTTKDYLNLEHSFCKEIYSIKEQNGYEANAKIYTRIVKELLTIGVSPLRRQPLSLAIERLGEAEFQMEHYNSALTYASAVYLSYSRSIVSQSWLNVTVGYIGSLAYALNALKPKDLRPFLGGSWTFTDWFSLRHHLHVALYKANAVRHGTNSGHVRNTADIVAHFASQPPKGPELDWAEEKWAIFRENAIKQLYEQVGVRQP
jgi:hypothetical protein